MNENRLDAGIRSADERLERPSRRAGDLPPPQGPLVQEVLEASSPSVETRQIPVARVPEAGFPIVGIGASAGGLAAFEAFFSAMPADIESGMAFVLVQHLAPDHESILSELVRRYTGMQVYDIEDGMEVRPNCAYTIPPNRDMAFMNGTLQLMEPTAPRGLRLPIDFFFRSLAQDQHERAICIVLSGTGSDGTLGVRAVKGEGGLIMVQDPDSTEYDGMPRSAIATGLVDYVLPPAEMPAQLTAYVTHAFGKKPRPAFASTPKAENTLKKICVLLRDRTGHDFSQYKETTLTRRVERRMAIHQIERPEEYLRYLQSNPAELDALFRDLLIGVTSFFRDPKAFQALQAHVIPRLFAGKPAGAPIRVWVCGCSTGEEAYSICILIQEYLESLQQAFSVQVFATDIDDQAIEKARSGIFPASIAADVSPERLARFFAQDPDGAYRIHKFVRDPLVFSKHDVIKDPPFSKLDLISCRNLMIYMSGELQKKLIPLFHYALNPEGALFLGTSESVGEFSTLFAALNRKWKLYLHQADVPGAARPAMAGFAPSLWQRGVRPHPPRGEGQGEGRVSLRQLTEQTLLQHYAQAGLLINGRGEILHIYGRTGKFLEPAPGDAGVNILLMAREGLRRELTTALHRVVTKKEPVHYSGLRVKTNGEFISVKLTVRQVASDAAGATAQDMFLVILEEAPPAGADLPGKEAGPQAMDIDGRIAALEQELRAREEYLQTTIEELETSNEELRSTNEEIQSVNEELQSTNEELETSKEELQSVNEELATVNAELQAKVSDLSQANNDMSNLLTGTGVGTIFVDLQLRIARFTPAATHVINLIQTDVGRPVGHIVSNLVKYDRLVEDVQAVLNHLVPMETEVQTQAGAWYLMRILPYRTLGNVIEGAVITFVEITEQKKLQESLRESEALGRLAVVVRDSHDAITVQDFDGRILAWNPGAERIFGWSESEALGMNIRDLVPEDRREEALAMIRKLSRAREIEPSHVQRIARDGQMVEVWLTATALVDETGKAYAFATTERNIADIIPDESSDDMEQ